MLSVLRRSFVCASGSTRAAGVRAALLALGLFVVFNANLRSIESRDTTVSEYAALAFASNGRGNLDRYPVLVETGVAKGYVQFVDGHPRSSYPVVPVLMAAPFYRVAVQLRLVDEAAPIPNRLEAVGKIVASGCVAVACAFVYLLLRVWRPAAPAAAVAVAAALGTSLWSSASQALWSHAPAAVFLSAGLGAALVVPRGSPARPFALAVSAVALVLAVACRPLLVVFLVGAAVGVLMGGESRRAIVAFALAAVVAVSLVATLNQWTMGTPFGGQTQVESAEVHRVTHGVERAWSLEIANGLAGVLFSPSRGLLIFTPLSLLALAGGRTLWREGGVPRYGIVCAVAAFLLLWSSYAVWWGGHSYGPRYSADIAIPLSLLGAAAVERWRVILPPLRVAVVAAFVWSVGVQAIGAFCYPAGEWNGLPEDVDRAHYRLWDWRDSQIARTRRAGLYQRVKGRPAAPAVRPASTEPAME